MSFFSKFVNTEKSASTKEQKQIDKKLKQLNSVRYNNKKVLSAVEIQNSYFGDGVLVKDSTTDNVCYIDILSGLHFSNFGKKGDDSYDLREFLVREDNIEYVLASLKKIYEKSDQIMEGCYNEIYSEIIKFFEESDVEGLKSDFNLEYLKENWYLSGVAIYDDHAEFSIGIDAAGNSEEDSYYEIVIFVDYGTEEAEVSFNVVW